jgi:phenylalanyl-tRNA synthetase alpha chain
MITYKTHETFTIALTPEGAQIAQEGSHEARVWAALPAKGEGEPFTEKQLQEKVGAEAAKIGRGRAFRNGWIANEGAGFVKSVSPECDLTVPWSHALQAASIEDSTRSEMVEIHTTGALAAGEKVLADLRKRKLVIQK